MKFRLIQFVPALVASAVCFASLQSCSSTKNATQITQSWKDPETTSNYRDFFVAVITKNLNARTALENNISANLVKEGSKAVKSLDYFPHTEKVESPEEKKAAVEKIQSLGHDAIITVVLVRVLEEERYTPGKVSYQATNIGYGTGYNDANNFTGYYTNASSLYSTPSRTEVNYVYFLKTNVYDAKSSKLIWSAQSETFNPGHIKTASRDFANVMTLAMTKAGLVYRESVKK